MIVQDRDARLWEVTPCKARGYEPGAPVWFRQFTVSLVGCHPGLGSELLFVGDGGTTEPNDAARRCGAEATLFWRPTDWLTLDASGAVTHARLHDVAPGQARIPNSVDEVLSAGAVLAPGHGISGSLRVRPFGAAPLIEGGAYA
ncbi:hypothetical protein [Sphingomonas solaris]|uniref:Uncharacterized protein n=1 Tax=Alterirhizorhabdus solaris TaxID=2529389 RepID=A0A558RA27_9SPHN|nr:hypothetical protein [Sphingomonas solaris]TVV76243.1 hypothetical protein FOY91_04885 [Sphingomonas solaris]